MKARSSLFVSLLFGLSALFCSDDPEDSISLFDSIDDHLFNGGYFHDGEWDLDFNDSVFYGPAYYIRQGLKENNADYIRIAEEAIVVADGYLEQAQADPFGYLVDHFDEVLFAMLAIIEYTDATSDTRYMARLDEMLNLVDSMLATVYHNYLEVEDIENYYYDTYGATVTTDVFVLINLQYALLLDTELGAQRVESARAILQAIDDKVWNGTFYEKDPGNERLFLYPNIVHMLCLTRMYQATNEAPYLERAEALFAAIQPLKMDYRPGYRSPYSAEYMGATTDDYSTLSSNNYVMFALALLYQATQKQVYRDELNEIIRFITDYLWVPGDGKVYHHWMDGHLAVPTDPEYYCSGCNLQLLYLLWWIEENLP